MTNLHSKVWRNQWGNPSTIGQKVMAIQRLYKKKQYTVNHDRLHPKGTNMYVCVRPYAVFWPGVGTGRPPARGIYQSVCVDGFIHTKTWDSLHGGLFWLVKTADREGLQNNTRKSAGDEKEIRNGGKVAVFGVLWGCEMLVSSRWVRWRQTGLTSWRLSAACSCVRTAYLLTMRRRKKAREGLVAGRSRL